MRILVAEKDSIVRQLIVTRLEARHYQVLETDSSEEALRLLDATEIDMILISTDMERINGRHLIEKIRENPSAVSVPVMMLAQENQISELLMIQEWGFDDFLIKPFSALSLQLRIQINIARIRERMEINPLSHLPGNLAIEKMIRQKIERQEKFSVLYMDINNFKAFNDAYGFEKGDRAIRQTSRILTDIAKQTKNSCFVGHIGGDDFIVITSPEDEEIFAKKVISDFDRLVPVYYSEEDQKRGYLRSINRKGKKEQTPLMSISIAACNNLFKNYQSLGEIAQAAAEVKSFLKSQPGSHYLRDRRNEPFQKIEDAARVLNQQSSAPARNVKMDPMGKMLLEAGLLSEETLQRALAKHHETGERLGQVLIKMNLVPHSEVGKLLEKKLNVSYISLDKQEPSKSSLRVLTLDFMKSHRVVPLGTDSDGLVLGMCDPFDLRTLDAIERVTRLKPVPKLVLEGEFENFIEKMASISSDSQSGHSEES